ncbi:hypothetical protein HPB48_015960 [Haemaphysalis longicornis]|uniref:RING-type domain-containing protein n=1 Tax=Haemaphysalis longicornis TaxID=44386 RepID=A0A9J6FUY5_HAELO|nr:hypothetical protein HPB48_015960 [Haemaphysalis longicornis]
MAHGSQEFVVVGYSEYLERKPLKFVDPIPAAIICSTCGIIPRQTFSLQCGHVLCEPCYQSCTTTSECVCPLDGDVSGIDDVINRKYPVENLLRKKVYCWNEANGCRVVLPASHVTDHIRHDCKHHVTRCFKCSAVVLSRDVCAHLKSRCSALVLHAAPATQQDADNNEKTQLVAFEKSVAHRVRELDAKLSQLSLESGSQTDKITELCHTINHLKETLTEQSGPAAAPTMARSEGNEAEMKASVAFAQTIAQRVGELDGNLGQLSPDSGSHGTKLIDVCNTITHLMKDLTKQIQRASDSNVAEIKALYTHKSESLLTAITSVLTSVPSDRKTHQRVVKGYAALKEKALKNNWSDSMSEKVYLGRYLMSWGIDFGKDGDSVKILLSIQLHEGREDEFLDWPFRKRLKLSIIHPETRQELHRCGRPDSSEANRNCFCRPIGGTNRGIRLGASRVATSELELAGYVKGDQLLVRFEVLM